MKALKNIIILALSLTIFGCSNQAEQAEKKEIEVIKHEEVVSSGVAKTVANIGIEGMTCAVGCAKRIENELNSTSGIETAQVIFEDKIATVEFDDSKISEEDIVNVIEKLGDYEVNKVEVNKTVIKEKQNSDNTEIEEEKSNEKTIEQVSFRNISFPNIFDVLTRLYHL